MVDTSTSNELIEVYDYGWGRMEEEYLEFLRNEELYKKCKDGWDQALENILRFLRENDIKNELLEIFIKKLQTKIPGDYYMRPNGYVYNGYSRKLSKKEINKFFGQVQVDLDLEVKENLENFLSYSS